MGQGERRDTFTLQNINVPKGAMLYLCTDGYADQFGGPKGKKFKYRQLEDILISISALPVEEQKDFLNAKFNEWQGNLEQIDDVLIMGIRV